MLLDCTTMDSNCTDEAVKDQGANNSHPSFTDKDFEGHRAHSVYVGPLSEPGHRRHGHHRRRHHRHHHRRNGDGDSEDDKPLTPPAQRVQFILGENGEEDDMHEIHPLFSEMEELYIEGNGDMEWRETARWVKFEEDVEEGGNRWSKPHVATLSLHSLFELRSCILNGTVMLDMDANNLEQIADLILDNMVNLKQLVHEDQDRVKEILLRRHRHQHEKRHDNNKGSRIPLIRSLADIGRVHSSSKSNSSTGAQEPGMTQSPSGTSLHRNQSGGHLNPTNASDGMSVSASTAEMQQLKGNQHFMKKIPPGAEASNILVGELDFLERTLCAFVRLNQAVMLGDLTEVPVPTRFIFLLLGPQGNVTRYHEIGRAVATLLSDEVFHDVAYKGKNRLDLLAGLDEFLDAVTVLPPGEWDPSIRIEPPNKIPSQEHRKLPDQFKEEIDVEDEEEREREESGLKRSGKLFGGLINDVKRKTPWFLSDFKDAFALQCLASFIFLYFACLTPIITFGGLLGNATKNNMATIESLIAGCLCGIVYSLFSGQPLTILSSTGPVLVFETICFSFCEDNGLDYLPLRLWIGLWTGIILLLLVAFDASAFVCYITRFTEESFACLISLIFIYKAVENIFHMAEEYPINPNPDIPLVYDCTCNATNATDYPAMYNWTDIPKNNCSFFNGTLEGPGCDTPHYYPDVFLMSVLLFLLTFVVATGLKEVKNSPFFPSKVRELINDFAVTIAILGMTLTDFCVGLGTPKLIVPHEFTPTLEGRGWLISPFGERNPWWTAIAAIFPALLATILIFMDQQISAVIVNRKEHKLRKGGGYHLDLFVLSILMILCSVMGLPWFVAGTVLSVTHVNSLKMESETAAPGEKPQFLGVRENRVTHLLIFILVGCSVLFTPVLKYIPTPILYGVFLYMGTSSLKGLQFIDRIMIMFMPVKYQPDYIFLRQVPLMRVHLFTVVQVVCLACLWVIKSYKVTSIIFPLMLVVLIVVRKLLDFVFTQRELKILDDVMPESTKRKREEEKRRKSQIDEEVIAGMLECQDEGLKIGPSGNLQIPLANGNIMKIPVDKMKYDPELNISEEVNKTGIWKQVNNCKRGEENGKKSKKDSSKKKRCSKKDAMNDEERKRLSTMAEDDEDDDMPIMIKIESPTPNESKSGSPGGEKKPNPANHNETSV